MGDHFKIEIKFGGNVTTEDLQEITEQAFAYGMGIEWEDSTMSDLRRILENWAVARGYPALTHPSCDWGNIEELENLLTLKGLTWVKRICALYEYDGELKWWKPGMKSSEDCLANANADEPILTLETLQGLRVGGMKKVSDVIDYLQFLVPEVPPLALVDTHEAKEV